MACACNLSSMVGWCGNIDTVLTLKAPIMTAADDKWRHIS